MGTQIDVDVLVNALKSAGEHQKHDLPAGYTIGTNKPHGPNGIFGVMGLERPIFSTRVQANGIMPYLRAYPSNDTHPIVGYLTGFRAGTGSEPEGPCDDPPRAGSMKSCFQGSAFGRVTRATQVIDLSNAGQRINRGEMFDLELQNDPLLSAGDMLVPPSVPANQRRALLSQLVSYMIALGVEFEDVLSHMVWTGSPLNNSAANGYMEYLGLESLVTTGHVDVLTGVACPSLDSDIKDFNYMTVSGNAATLFYYLTTMWRFVNHNADRMNMRPVQWAWVMPEGLFREISDFWPCVYASYRCNATANQLANNVDGLEMRRMSDEMFNGNYLQIDGVRIPVITDDALPVHTNINDGRVANTCSAADIYLLPFVVKGGTPVLYMEYFDFRGPGAALDIVEEGRLGPFMWSDAGAWLWTSRQNIFCFDWIASIQPRLRLLTPHLAGRLMNVQWCPLQNFRQPFHDDPYFVNGGNYLLADSIGLPYTNFGR